MSDYMDYAYKLAEDIGPRFASTEEERKSAEEIANWMADAGLQPEIEDLSCSALPRWPYLVFYAVAVVAALLSRFTGALSIVMFVLAIAALGCFLCERYFKPVFSGLIKNGFSQNVVAKYNPTGTDDNSRSRKIVVMAHYDSPYSSTVGVPSLVNIYPYLQYVMLAAMILIPVLMLMGMLPFAKDFRTILWIITCVVAIIPLAGVAFLLIEHFAMSYPDGANGNASGVAAMMEVLDLLQQGGAPDARQFTGTAQATRVTRRGEEAAEEAGVVPEGARVSYEPPVRAEREAYAPEASTIEEDVPEAEAPREAFRSPEVQRETPRPAEAPREAARPVEAPREAARPADRQREKPVLRQEPEEPKEAAPTQKREVASGVKPLQRSSAFNGSAQSPAQAIASADAQMQSTPREREVVRKKAYPDWWMKVEGNREKEAKEAKEAAEAQAAREARAAQEAAANNAEERASIAQVAAPVEEAQVRSRYADIPGNDFRRSNTPEAKHQADETDRILESVKADSAAKDVASVLDEVEAQSAAARQPESMPAVPADAGETQSWTTDQLADASAGMTARGARVQNAQPARTQMPAVEDSDFAAQPQPAGDSRRADGRLSHLPSFENDSAFPASPSYADRSSRVDEEGSIFGRTAANRSESARADTTSSHMARLDNIMDMTSDNLRQQAPVADKYEDTIQSGRTGARLRIPSIEQDEQAEQSAPDITGSSSPVFSAGSFAAGETGAFVPVGNSGVLPNINLDDDMVIEDADDTMAGAAGNTGEFSVPSSIQMPDSGRHRFRDKFFSHGKKNSSNDDQQGAAEWLGVDKHYNPTKEGANIGSWDNFEEDEGDDWKGGAAAGGYGSSRSSMRESVLDMVDRDLLDKEIWFVALGASDSSHKGIESFLEKHGTELRSALFINLDSVGAGSLSCLSREGHGPFPAISDYRLQTLARKSSTDLGIDLMPRALTWTETDATKAIKQGHRAITFMRFDREAPVAWHQPSDNCDILDPACIAETADLVAEMIRRS